VPSKVSDSSRVAYNDKSEVIVVGGHPTAKPYENDPRTPTAEQRLGKLKELVQKVRLLSLQHGFNEGDITFVNALESFSEEESVFADRETLMSQSLLRVSIMLEIMVGADRTSLSLGGLGGLEATNIAEMKIVRLLEDLKSLGSAERLVPGKYKILCGPGMTGVIAHEAFGHSQEADTCARGRSKAWELHKTGEKVGNQHATILSSSAVYQNGIEPCAAWGSYYFDEEGWLASEAVILEQGILMAPMTNLTSALRLGVPRSANGKRESWASGVYSRQTNTYFSPETKTLAELMAMVDDGFLGTEVAGGMEDPKGMGIQVGAQYLKEIKSGILTGRVFRGPAGGDIQLTGYVPEVLNSIIDKSKIEAETTAPDRARHPVNDLGGCGKYHKEFVLAGCGGTYMLLDNMTLG
jgi:TldD protein